MQAGVDTLETRRITNRTTSLSRTNIVSRDRFTGTVGDTRKTDVTIKSNQLHSLDKKEFYNELCVQLKQGSFNLRNNFVSELYGCLKNHPNYKGDLVFTKDMSVNKIVSLIRDKIDDLMPDNAETLIEYSDDEMQISSHVALDMICNQRAMPLKWMIKLRYKNPKLYTIVRNVISLVKGKFHIQGFDDGFSEMAKESFYYELIDCQDDADFIWNKKGFTEVCSADEINQWGKWNRGLREIKAKDGKGYLLLNEINDIYRMIDEDWLIDQMNSYKPKSKIYNDLLQWAKDGYQLYLNHNGVNIHDLVFLTEDEYEQGHPVTALDFLKFEWDFRCPFWEFGVEQWLNDHAGQVGVVETRAYSVLRKDHYLNTFDEKYELFGKELEEWFDFGTDIYYQEIWDWEKR
jgi:hypothetical protein